MKILITSGGCKVPIDSVRHIGNFSSGRYGADLATVFAQKGMNHVHFLHERGSKKPKGFPEPYGGYMSTIINYEYKDYYEYVDKVKSLIKGIQPDIIISAAAISDYIAEKTEGKISSDSDELVIRLKKGEKVIQSFRKLAPRAYIVGCKLLVSPTEEEKYNAIEKQLNHVNVTIYNDLTDLRAGKSGRELVYWAEENKLGSVKNLTVSEMVDEISSTASIHKALKL